MNTNLNNKKILIIEDDKFLGDVLFQKLSLQGFSVELSSNGKEGFENISKNMPDLILLDIMLPDMNGYEILEAKNLNPNIAKIPVIVISNSGQQIELSRIQSLGVKEYLIKATIDAEEVIDKVKKVFIESQQIEDKNNSNILDNDDSIKLNVNTSENNSNSSSSNSASNTTGSMSNIHIAWVEDDKFLSDILARKFYNQKAKLFHSKTGPELLEYLKNESPDVIVLDVMLPGMNGFEILEKVKMDPTKKDIPVMMLSNLGQPGDLERSKMLGAEKFIVKATASLDEIVRNVIEVAKK